MAVYRRTSRTRNVLLVLVLAALTLVTIDSRSPKTGVLSHVRGGFSDAFSPLQRATHAALQPIGNFLTGALDYGSLRNENQRLREQVADLQNQSVQSAAEKAAAEQVLGLEGLPFVGSIPTVTAEIVDNGFSNFEITIVVDKGTDSGVAPGQPVVGSTGLVGSVEAASAHTATIVLLTNPSFSVGVRLPNANIGTAQGVGSTEPMRVSVDTTNSPAPAVRPGEVLVTSGLDLESFPANIPVGRIVNVTREGGDTDPTITLAPVVKLGQLDYVQILLWSHQ